MADQKKADSTSNVGFSDMSGPTVSQANAALAASNQSPSAAASLATRKATKKELAVPVTVTVTKGTITTRDGDGEDLVFEVGDSMVMPKGEAIEKRALGLVDFQDS